MKKLYITLAMAAFCYNSYAQNTFPGTGNVGIGTTSPSSLLTLNSLVPYSTIFKINNTFTGVGVGNNFTMQNNGTDVASLQWIFNGANFITSQIAYGEYTINTGTSYIERMRINSAGNVGIGTTSPAYKFDVENATLVNDASAYIATFNGGTDPTLGPTAITFGVHPSATGNNRYGFLAVGDNVNVRALILNMASNGIFGNVGIGTTDTKGYQLAVNGNVIATSMTVKLYSAWPDYVFKPTYQLPTLTAIKTYIDQNQHLPDMPSAQEVEKNGVNLGEMVKLQAKKIEELTLYLIEKDKEVKEIQSKLKELSNKINNK
jgi:uncharacterized coiled-coil protein SlyX